MQQGAPNRHPLRLASILTAMLLFVTACLGGGGGDGAGAGPGRQFGHESLLTGQAWLACSSACAERGHCGDTPERGRVVLLSIPGPAAQRHDWAIAANTAVTVEEARDESISLVMTGETQTARFYRVNVVERGGSAWVAGWCLANSPATP